MNIYFLASTIICSLSTLNLNQLVAFCQLSFFTMRGSFEWFIIYFLSRVPELLNVIQGTAGFRNPISCNAGCLPSLGFWTLFVTTFWTLIESRLSTGCWLPMPKSHVDAGVPWKKRQGSSTLHEAKQAVKVNIDDFTDNTGRLMHWENAKEISNSRSNESFRWNPYHRAPAADIEMTSYALMTYVLLAEDDPSLIGEAMPIVRWLTKQRNALGGFASTQVIRERIYLFCNVCAFEEISF